MKKKRTTLFCVLAAPIVMAAQTPLYQRASISPQERAADLCSRLTLEEKSLIMMDNSPAIPRLGIPQFQWWSEALHGVARNGYATVFPQSIGMAAAFDDELLYRVFCAASDEARAKNTAQRKKNRLERYQGLSFWTPNVNIFRDPRWGRGQETYGEDPYLTTRMGLAVVKGLQGDPTHRYTKLYACAKHFAVHSGPEWSRHRFNADNISSRDLWETYLPAFKALVQTANVKEVMCAYNRYEGNPCCGSNRLLTQILRQEWGFKGIVVSDCGAISDFWEKGKHETEPDAQSASAKAVVSGTDVECGNNYRSLPEAVKEGKISESQIDINVKRLLAARFELGDFDPDSLNDWCRIPVSVIACEAHKNLSLQMARESMTLLQNKDGILPLPKKGMKIIVMGPNADNPSMQWGNYNGSPTKTVSILKGIENKIGHVGYVKGCEHCTNTTSESRFGEVLSSNGEQGFTATYWNNTKMEGEPAASQQVRESFNFDLGGNTVYAPGVVLENFSAKYLGTFTPTRSEKVKLSVNCDNGIIIIANNDTIIQSWGKHRSVSKEATLNVKAGDKYQIEIDYCHYEGEGSLKFDMTHERTMSPAEAANLAKDADAIIFIGGLSPKLEGEEMHVNVPGFKNGDRTDIQLPEAQREVIAKLHQMGKKVVFVNCSGSAIGLVPETENADAILQAWYPGELGGTAVADVLFGDFNPQGKLPITFYKDTTQLPSFEDYNMKGRTYRYFTGTPLYPFGFGLSYTTFALGKGVITGQIGKNAKLSFPVINTGKRDGTYVAQLYIRKLDDQNGPVRSLREFKRIEVKAGETKNVTLDLTPKTFECFDTHTNTMKTTSGRYELLFGSSSDLKDLQSKFITIP